MGIIPESSLLLNIVVIAVCFAVLTKSADLLVDGSVAIAYRFKIPKIIIGIVLVGFATTTPEFTVSLISAVEGLPGIALGNAVGSVIADNGLALGLGIVVAPAAVLVHSRSINIYGFFLLGISVLSFILVANGVVSRWEGILLLGILIGYMSFILIDSKRRKNIDTDESLNEEIQDYIKKGGLTLQVLRFLGGLAGVILASWFLVDSAKNIATTFGVSEAVIGLTIVAIGTSLPEIATCFVACRKGHGDLALGDILGANILNLLWIVGAASTVNPIRVTNQFIYFSYPSMFVFVVVLLVFARWKYRLERWKGWILLILYLIYLAVAILLFYLYGISMDSV
jgi:cation:H+ antiporter